MWEHNKELSKSRQKQSSIITCTLFNRVKGDATQKNREFNLDKQYFNSLVTSNCHYCNAVPSMICNPSVKVGGRHGKRGYNYERFALYNGLDRVDNSKGYILGNVVPCCKNCNIGKSKMDIKDFLIWIKKVHDHMKM